MLPSYWVAIVDSRWFIRYVVVVYLFVKDSRGWTGELVVEVRSGSAGDRMLSWNSKTQAEMMSQVKVKLSSCGVT